MLALLVLLTSDWHGYSYSGDPGQATGWGRLTFDGPVTANGRLADNSAQYNHLIALRPMVGALPGAVRIYWAASFPGSGWTGPGSVSDMPNGYRSVRFDGPGGRIEWVLEPDQR